MARTKKQQPDPEPCDLVVKAMELKATEKSEERRRTFVASTSAIDADGDIVEQDFILDRFIKNPVILFAHNSRELPIGRAENIGIVDGKLQLDVVFASEKANPKAEQVYQSVLEGSLRAMSIGFLPRSVRLERRDDKDVFVLSQNELYEASITPIPSNPEALAKMKAKALEDFDLTPPWEQESSANGGEEKEMDVEQLQKELAEGQKKIETLTERYAALEKLYSDEQQRASDLLSEIVAKRVEALIGTKIAPAEKDSLVKLASVDRALFEEQMKAIESRPNMPYLKGPVLPPEPPAPPALPAADGISGTDLNKLIERQAFGS